MIRFGPSGIPLSCKGRTLRDGIEDVHTLGLTALEIQMVRTNTVQRYATDEDIGRVPREIMDELVIEVLRGSGKRRTIANLDEPIKKGDIICTMINPIADNFEHLKELGDIARNLDVLLSLHTPYYIDLVANNDLTVNSLDSIRWGGLLAREMGATIVITHLGMYGDLSRKKATKRITENIASVQEWYRENKIKIPLGLETSGRQEIFGDFSEIIKICEEVKGPIPVLNFPHIHARGNGALKKKEDFQELFEQIEKFSKNDHYTHFSGVEHEDGNEIRYTPIKKGDLKFEPLAECILDNDFDMTIISGSPLLEHDAMYMRVILERVLAKREAKAERQKKKDEKKERVPEKPEKKEVPPKKPASPKAAKKPKKTKPSKTVKKPKKPATSKAAKKPKKTPAKAGAKKKAKVPVKKTGKKPVKRKKTAKKPKASKSAKKTPKKSKKAEKKKPRKK